MVTITVILAAVIATFVLGLGESVSNTAPQASFTNDFDSNPSATDDSLGTNNNGLLTITHSGSDTIFPENLFVTGGDNGRQPWEAAGQFTAGSEITAGNGVDYATNTDDTVRVVWSEGQGDSAELDRWSGPDA